MPQKTDKFSIYLNWENTGDANKDKAFSEFIYNRLSEIKKKFSNCGLDWFYTKSLDNFKASRIDVVFKLKPYLSQLSGTVDYNHFVGAVRAFDKLAESIPKELNPTGTYSTTDYKAPWVQRGEFVEAGLVVRKGACTDELYQKDLARMPPFIDINGAPDPIKNVKVVGESTEVRKVVATLRQLLKRKKLTITDITEYINHYHFNTRWVLLLTTDKNHCYAYGYSVTARNKVSLENIWNLDLPLTTLKPKYPNTKVFGTDMFVLAV